MKKYFIILALLCLSFFNSNAMLIYEKTMDIISTNKVERFPAYMVTDKQSYINGGLVFNYPPGLFTSPPVISVTISAATQIPILSYMAIISAESLTSATVTVYKTNVISLLEALTGEVTVHFMAVGT